MLDEGLMRSRKRLPWSEYGIILMIFVVIIAFGLFEGVGAGMLATLVFFAVRLSHVDPDRIPVHRARTTEQPGPSVPDRAILLAEGERVQVYRLRGYIFFGSVSPLADQLKESLAGPSRPRLPVAGLRRRLGLRLLGGERPWQVPADSEYGRGAGGTERFVRAVADRVGAQPSTFGIWELLLEPNADRGLERCEEIVIAAWRADAKLTDKRRTSLLEHAVDDLERHLERQIHFEDW